MHSSFSLYVKSLPLFLSFFASGCKGHQVHPLVVQFFCIFDHICVLFSPCLLYLSPPLTFILCHLLYPSNSSPPSLFHLSPCCSLLVHIFFSLFSYFRENTHTHHPCYPFHFSSLALFPPAHTSFQPEWPREMLLSFVWICLQLESHSEPLMKSWLSNVVRDGLDEIGSSISIYWTWEKQSKVRFCWSC